MAKAFGKHLDDRDIPFTLVAEIKHEPVGMISLVNCDVGMEHRANLWPWVAAVYVVPERQGQGIGKQLLETMTVEAKTLNISKLYLYTTDKVGFYERYDWAVVDYEILDQERVTILSKSL